MQPCVVSIVIVNYNAGELLSRCLRSIEAQTFQDYEIIIVDNASSDTSLEMIQATPRVKIIRNEQNIGFAAAQNQGMKLAHGQYLMPLNFDIEMTPQFLAEMVAAIQMSPNIGIVTGKLMQMGVDGQYLNVFYSTGHVLPPCRCIYHRGLGEQDVGQYDKMAEVFGASGAAPLYKREMLEDISFHGNFFDESLFTWYEDVDLDWRANTLGWKCLYTPKAIAYHIGHLEGHGGDLWKIGLQIRNRWLIILANDNFWLFSKATIAMLLYELRLGWYVLSRGYLSAYYTAFTEFFDLIPNALAKRRWTLQRARSRTSK